MKKLSKMQQRVNERTTSQPSSGERAMRRQMREMGYTNKDLASARKEVSHMKAVISFDPKQKVKLWTPEDVSPEPDNELDEAWSARQEARALLKGKQGENCNRTACQAAGAFFRNNGTRKYYCIDCTIDIGGFAMRTNDFPMDLYPDFDQEIGNYEAYLLKKWERNPEMATKRVERAKQVWAHAREIFAKNTAQT
ncbi:hypothetical protein D3C71_77410 [compost metagenome]